MDHVRAKQAGKKVLNGIGILLVLLVLSNLAFFVKRVQFYIYPPKVEHQSSDASVQMEPNTLRIAVIDVTAPIVEPEAANEASYQKALQHGVVHYPGTADVGQFGNAYLFGHSSDYPFTKGDYKTVFALLPKLKAGDNILVSDKNGKPYTYRVIETKVVAKNDLSVLSQHDNKEKLLTLQTSYPIGTALKRYIVEAKLIE